MKHIFLIGFMGCGKSSIGKKLSFQLKKPFTDLDSMVEVKEKRTINQIFEEDGEQSFRDMETSVLISMFDTKLSYVIATGGGLVMREKNRRIMKKQGIIIYLKASADTLYERLEGDEKRPLLQTEDPKAKIEQLLNERGPIYEKIADIFPGMKVVIMGEDGAELTTVLPLDEFAATTEKGGAAE